MSSWPRGPCRSDRGTRPTQLSGAQGMTMRRWHYTLCLTSGWGPSWVAHFSPVRTLGLHGLDVSVSWPCGGQGTVWGQESPGGGNELQSYCHPLEGATEEAARKTHHAGRPPVLLPLKATESHPSHPQALGSVRISGLCTQGQARETRQSPGTITTITLRLSTRGSPRRSCRRARCPY